MTNDQNAQGPERIYLQVPDDEFDPDHPIDWASGDRTWCADSIFEHDVEYVRADIHDAVVKDQEELRKRMTLLFKCIAPECEPFDYCHGLLSQIDNAIYGMKQKIEKLTGRPVPLTEWQKLELERDALQRQLATLKREHSLWVCETCGKTAGGNWCRCEVDDLKRQVGEARAKAFEEAITIYAEEHFDQDAEDRIRKLIEKEGVG